MFGHSIDDRCAQYQYFGSQLPAQIQLAIKSVFPDIDISELIVPNFYMQNQKNLVVYASITMLFLASLVLCFLIHNIIRYAIGQKRF